MNLLTLGQRMWMNPGLKAAARALVGYPVRGVSCSVLR